MIHSDVVDLELINHDVDPTTLLIGHRLFLLWVMFGGCQLSISWSYWWVCQRQNWELGIVVTHELGKQQRTKGEAKPPSGLQSAQYFVKHMRVMSLPGLNVPTLHV